jgi:hypothetical protein
MVVSVFKKLNQGVTMTRLSRPLEHSMQSLLPPARQRASKQHQHGFDSAAVVRISPETEISVVRESTPERVKAAVLALKRGMPPAAKPGQKSAVQQREEMWR